MTSNLQAIVSTFALATALLLIGCEDKEKEGVPSPIYTPPSVGISIDRDQYTNGDVATFAITIIRGSSPVDVLEVGFADSTRIDTTIQRPQNSTLALPHCLRGEAAGLCWAVARVTDSTAHSIQAVCQFQIEVVEYEPPSVQVTAPDSAYTADSVLIRFPIVDQFGIHFLDPTLTFGDLCGGHVNGVDTFRWDSDQADVQVNWTFTASGLCPFVARIVVGRNLCYDTSSYVISDTAIVRVIQHP